MASRRDKYSTTRERRAESAVAGDWVSEHQRDHAKREQERRDPWFDWTPAPKNRKPKNQAKGKSAAKPSALTRLNDALFPPKKPLAAHATSRASQAIAEDEWQDGAWNRKPASYAKPSPSKPAPSPKKVRQKIPQRQGGVLGSLAYWTLVCGLWTAIAVGGLLFYYAATLPDMSRLWDVADAPSLSIVSADGEPLSHRGNFQGGQVQLEHIPPHVAEAVIATEDQRFYWHFGVDPVGLARAMVENFEAGRIVQGGSTITQQLAKNIFLTPDRTMNRKVQEMLLALWLEARYSKDEILSLYLNRVYFGGGAYGIEGAAERYFKKTASELTLAEAAMLAGLLKAPSHYSPTNDLVLARRRAAIVIDNMLRAGYITQAEAQYALAHPASLEGYSARGSINYFVDWVADVLPGFAGEPSTDLVVQTTIDRKLQTAAEESVASILAEEAEKAGVSQVALVAMSPDGAVRAMVGGKSYGQSQFNRAVQALRQPGSAFKPFVYLTAMERGLTPDTIRVDRQVSYGGWMPANYSGRFEGPMSLRHALADSINTVAVQLAQEVGVRNVIRTAKKLGLQQNLPNNLSLALGTCDVTLLELTAAYAAFANGGYGVIAHGIDQVRARNGEEIYRRSGSGLGPVMDAQTLGKMNDMLKDVLVEGTGKRAALADRPAAGKTGTSQDFRDAWFIGYTADLVVGVWVGNDDRTPMNKVTGGTLPATIWHRFMERTQTGLRVAALPGSYLAQGAVPSESAAMPAPEETTASQVQITGAVTEQNAQSNAKREWEEPGFFERLFGVSSGERDAN